MFNIHDFSLQLTANPLTIIIGSLVLALFSFWMYRITIPKLNSFTKWFLLILRAVTLILLMILIFEPLLLIKTVEIIKPEILLFADNSKSIKTDSKSVELMKGILNDFNKSSISGSVKIFEFSDSVRNAGERFSPTFSGRNTDFSNIMASLSKSEKNIAATVIVSDGIITNGTDPVNTAENLSYPFFTIGLGDTTKKKDISILNIIYNKTILAGSNADFLVSLEQIGFKGESTSLSLYEDNQLIEEKSLSLDENSTNTSILTYVPRKSGDRKITIKVKEMSGETNILNNTKTFYLKVLENRNNVLIIAGAPHPDVSFIKNSLQIDTSLKVKVLIQLSSEKYLGVTNIQPLIDSANTLFLVGFPSSNTSNNLLEKVRSIIKKGTPFFIIINSYTDLTKLKSMDENLPFSVSRISNGTMMIQPSIVPNQSRNPIISNSDIQTENSWDNLPPVSSVNWEIKPKAESETIANQKINNTVINIPLLLTRDLGTKKSASLHAFDIWKWKLQKAKSGSTLFDRFILNIQRWLSVSETRKQVRIETNKQIYLTDEKVIFFAEVYDKSYNPLSDALVKVNAVNSGEKTEIIFNHVKDGIYSSDFYPKKSGDYYFEGEALLNNAKIGNDDGRFSISKQDPELINTYINQDLLRLLSSQTNGRFYLNSDYKNIFYELEKLLKKTSSEKIKSFEFPLLANEYLLILIILLFAIEWFIRKRNGLQ